MQRHLASLKRAIALLLIAVLVIVPVADAFACSLEVDAAHAMVAAHDHSLSAPCDDAGTGGAPDGAHGGCAHSHCHHATADLSFGTAVSYDAACVVVVGLVDATLPPGSSEGPRRPPRS
ncbi:MAG: hypothetical protein J0H15_03600 [Xanthomonadales bacterium]|nr:hypothetical protein [Xanthomonadales bacterium]